MDTKRVIMGGIVLIIALTVVGAVLESYSPGRIWTPEWEYDDYKAVSDIEGGVSSASGSLEIVDISGIRMVHAKDVGPGKIKHLDGTTEDVTVEKAIVDVFLLMGQSNAKYRPGQADTSVLDPKPVPGTAYYYGMEDSCTAWENPGLTSILSFNLPDGSPRLGDKMPAIAAAYHEETGRKMLLINSAIGAQYITSYDPDGGRCWVLATTAVITSMAGLAESEYFEASGTYAYMFILGETDGGHGTTEAAYKQGFMKMHEAILKGKLGAVFSHCYLSLTKQGMADAQRQLAAEHPDTITVATDAALGFTIANGMLSDTWHYTQPADNIIGKALGEACASYVEDSGGIVGTIVEMVPILIAVAGVAAIVIYMIDRRNRF